MCQRNWILFISRLPHEILFPVTLQDLKPRLDADSPEPLISQLVRLLASEIRGGRLEPGSAIPGARTLSKELGVTRHVAESALQELVLEGWAVSRDRSGTYVSENIPTEAWGALPESPTGIPHQPAFDLSSRIQPASSMAANVLDLSEGLPDARLARQSVFARGYLRAVRRHGDELLGKGEPRGNLLLREHLAKYLGDHRGLRAKAENLFISRGTPMSLRLITSTLLTDGGHIAVENPGNRVVWETLRSVPGLHLHPVPVDQDGLDVDALEILLKRQKLDLVHVSPQYQFPTTAMLSEERRTKLLELARRHAFAILEDDPELEYYGSTGPCLPLASQDTEGRVIHLGSLSQLLAPGLCLGFMVAPKAVVDRMARVRQHLDIQGDRVVEWAVADYIRDGDFERHLARVRQIYTDRRQEFLRLLDSELGSVLEARTPSGGLGCWIHLVGDLDLDAWSLACRQAGVKFHPGRHYEFQDQSIPYLRLGFGALKTSEIHRALHCMRESMEQPSR